jgi:hypothetical protein
MRRRATFTLFQASLQDEIGQNTTEVSGERDGDSLLERVTAAAEERQLSQNGKR